MCALLIKGCKTQSGVTEFQPDFGPLVLFEIQSYNRFAAKLPEHQSALETNRYTPLLTLGGTAASVTPEMRFSSIRKGSVLHCGGATCSPPPRTLHPRSGGALAG